MGKQRKKSNKELRQEAQSIQIVVTSDNEEEPEIQEIKVLKNTSKNLAFDDDKIEYSVGDDLFAEVS